MITSARWKEEGDTVGEVVVTDGGSEVLLYGVICDGAGEAEGGCVVPQKTSHCEPEHVLAGMSRGGVSRGRG